MHELVPETAGPSDRATLLAAAISGLLYVLLVFVPQVDGPPVETASADQIRSFLTEHDTGLRASATAGALGIALVLVFTVSLARLIRGQSIGSPLADLVVGGGVLVAVWHWLMVAGASMTLVQTLDGTDLATVDDATLRSWYGMSNLTHFFGDLGMVAMATVMTATSIAVLRTGLFPRWQGWLGLILGIGGAVGTIGITIAWGPLANAWFVGIFGWFLWTLVLAVTCGLRLRPRSRRATSDVTLSPAA
jgi:Domain of unknown function (DUF4386)